MVPVAVHSDPVQATFGWSGHWPIGKETAHVCMYKLTKVGKSGSIHEAKFDPISKFVLSPVTQLIYYTEMVVLC